MSRLLADGLELKNGPMSSDPLYQDIIAESEYQRQKVREVFRLFAYLLFMVLLLWSQR